MLVSPKQIAVLTLTVKSANKEWIKLKFKKRLLKYLHNFAEQIKFNYWLQIAEIKLVTGKHRWKNDRPVEVVTGRK